jgi:hypothetical protein
VSTQRSSDAPQNLAEFERWRTEKNAYICDDHYLREVDRRWRMIGRLARQPASLTEVQRNT